MLETTVSTRFSDVYKRQARVVAARVRRKQAAVKAVLRLYGLHAEKAFGFQSIVQLIHDKLPGVRRGVDGRGKLDLGLVIISYPNSRAIIPVSYTHLDVYKRQMLAEIHLPTAQRML